jgi:hypothetical protein
VPWPVSPDRAGSPAHVERIRADRSFWRFSARDSTWRCLDSSFPNPPFPRDPHFPTAPTFPSPRLPGAHMTDLRARDLRLRRRNSSQMASFIVRDSRVASRRRISHRRVLPSGQSQTFARLLHRETGVWLYRRRDRIHSPRRRTRVAALVILVDQRPALSSRAWRGWAACWSQPELPASTEDAVERLASVETGVQPFGMNSSSALSARPRWPMQRPRTD